MNCPFSEHKFSAALNSCNSRSATGLDGIGCGVLLGMSDCVASVVTDILQGFGQAEGTLALDSDHKGAFNAVLPGVLIRQLIETGVPDRIVNFVYFLATRRMLYFSHSDDSPSLSSPLLCSI